MSPLNLSRRQWLGAGAGLLSAAALPLWAQAPAASAKGARIVIIGGGVGGATAAKYLKMFDPSLQVTVIEKNRTYIRPYGSSEVLNQHSSMDELNVSYDVLASRYGVNFVFDTVTGFDPAARTVSTAGKQRLALRPAHRLARHRVAVFDAYRRLQRGRWPTPPCLQRLDPWCSRLRCWRKQLQGMRPGRHLCAGRTAQPLPLPARPV
jgi:hypothetical protein